ncbi:MULTISPECIES: lema family protein [unclassified Variovorax]|uniref:lema family protein n=1 Tax=unclassified Variovorax TaxID=663243 RepID=UPI000F7DB76C|nr:MULTISPECIES: lema family protein [unclassified Variovorax]RSZ29666.1 lema family protein [Variovorax sp. 553]RSZ30207.1 lema family protein [Variovorax sp. 679]
MSVLPESLASWIVIAVLLFWFVGAYNRLVRLRAAVLQAYGLLDAALGKQLDFVEASIAAGPQPEVAPTGESLSSVAPLRAATTQLSTLLGATRLHPLDVGGMAALATALQVWIGAWRRQHPDQVTVFDADGTLSRPAQLQAGVAAAVPGAVEPIGWPEPSAAAEIARSQFNQAVAHYNAAIAQFPAVLVAWAVRLRPAAPLL